MEIFTPSQSRTEPVTVPNGLLCRLWTTYELREGSDTARIDFRALEALYMKALESRTAGPSRIVIYDHAIVFVDGKRVDGFSSLQVAVLEYLKDAKTASADCLIENVWRNPDTNTVSVYRLIERINQKLETVGCWIEKTHGGPYSIKFLS